MGSPMNKRLIGLALFIVTVILFLVGYYMYFTRTAEKYMHQENNLEVRKLIASDIRNNIVKTRSLYFRVLLSVDKKRALALNMHILHTVITEMKHQIDTLTNGGTYVKHLSLNIAGQDEYTKTYHHDTPQITIEALRLKPKIYLLLEKNHTLALLIQERIRLHNQPQTTQETLQNLHARIALFTKSIDTIFRRMEEDSNKLFYESQMQLTQVKKKLEQEKEYFNIAIAAMILLLLISFAVEIYYVITTLRRRLYYDTLTSLYSRAKLEEIPFGEHSLLLLVDIDDFSDINSLYGIETGDRVLRFLAEKLKHFDKKADYFRLSGDLFGILYTHTETDHRTVLEKIQKLHWNILHLSDNKIDGEIDISATIGAASGVNCLHDAFMALDIATTRKEHYWIFHEEHAFKEEIEFNRKWYSILKSAIEEDAIVPFYQPIVDREGAVVYHEALMRLKQRTDEGTAYISPVVFMGVAEKTKLYLPLSQSLITKAFKHFEKSSSGAFSINLSYVDMAKGSVRNFLKEMMEQHDMDGRVTFEILESSFIENYALIEEFIAEFRSYGVKFAIDDFGSGYSNPKRVVSLNPDYLKIDGGLIQQMLHDRKSYKMVENIVSYAKEFDIKTVAEFVSDEELFIRCREMGIDYFQGYYFAEPHEFL